MWRLLPGIVACVALAIVASLLGRLVPILGAPVFAILCGVAIATWRKPAPSLMPGISFCGKIVLQLSIVLLGARLSLREIAAGGLASLPVMLGTVVLVLLLAWAAGRALGVDRDLRRLLGIGTAICGGSAIAALASVIEVEASDVAYALGVVFAFNVVAVIAFPPLGHAMGLSQSAFGLWAGTAINDTSSVVAAAFSYGTAAGNDAVVVKLTRTLLIVPIVLYYAWRRIAGATGSGQPVPWRSILPWFIAWFLAASALNSAGVIPPGWQPGLSASALFAIVVALAGVGLGADAARMRASGARPLALGAILWIAIALASLGIARVTGIG